MTGPRGTPGLRLSRAGQPSAPSLPASASAPAPPSPASCGCRAEDAAAAFEKPQTPLQRDPARPEHGAALRSISIPALCSLIGFLYLL